MKKKVVLGLGIIVVIVVVLLAIFLGDKTLDLESDEIANLYSYLGEVDVSHCGGLNQYTGDEVTYDTLSNGNKLCMAYYELNDQVISKDNAQVTSTNDQDVPVCEIGEGIRLAAEEGEETCNYQVIKQEDLANSYRTVYGEDIPGDESFYISGTEACYLNGDEYYCGDAETFVVSLAPEATIYRLPNRAVEKMNGDIVITDYYLKISGNKCYFSNNTDDEVTACTTLLEENENVDIDSEFVQEYGVLYEHTFKQDQDGNYYWYSSNVK